MIVTTQNKLSLFYIQVISLMHCVYAQNIVQS